MRNSILTTLLASTALFSSCDNNENNTPETLPVTSFTVTIENAFTPKEFYTTGNTGLIKPGESESFSFNAGTGHYLNFATMFVQSNDLFYGPDDSGIALYDADGNAITGDLTSELYLWDAGTEMNEEPGIGVNQPPRQSDANTGITENGTVKLISQVNDGFTYPALQDVIQVEIAHNGGTQFTVTINNISNNASLATPFAPGNWVVHSADQYPIFKRNEASSIGLEGLAEDGATATLTASLEENSGLVSPFAPGAYNVGTENLVFNLNGTASSALEALAEDGDPSGFENHFTTPDQGSAPAPIFPSQTYSFTFDATDGQYLSLATMLVQSNDWFIGGDAINLFPNGQALNGDITSQLLLFDGGTEEDEYAGAGTNQAPRQSGPNTGTTETGSVIEETSPSSNVPNIENMIRISITSNASE
ncbi:hypothetical protein EI427_01445 [Flammeovirga pectinis]|uniref:Spondin domain-containing protein n=1 Tax=Flammeovirga pectinis TaxID=2494373 RepID=A0A3Q9FKX5_9BACT|nr:spondin domain-containing protein [Flammeovirga pectinis]AZQ60924.1 hypothetical protein EI427_01445 [Flammeovirga pectinis]